MVKLSDYLDYLYNEVTQARKLVDERSVKLAKEYSKHDYLKFFRVPRFTMPSVKLDIPLKIDEIDSEIEYELKIDQNVYISNVNSRINAINKEKGLKIKPISNNTFNKVRFEKVVQDLGKRNFRFMDEIENDLKKIDFHKSFLKGRTPPVNSDKSKKEKEVLNFILKDSIKKKFSPRSLKLNNIFIDPDTSKEKDKDKLLVQLKVEMVEEGIRIVNLKDESGQEIEEIVFE